MYTKNNYEQYERRRSDSGQPIGYFISQQLYRISNNNNDIIYILYRQRTGHNLLHYHAFNLGLNLPHTIPSPIVAVPHV